MESQSLRFDTRNALVPIGIGINEESFTRASKALRRARLINAASATGDHVALIA